ncbi:armadillo-type protein [Mycena metata]|uniref:Armadillo-type protein n=1 Tax=Mycena metata TaxID=1033252 RepID=A0AAD7NT67_9AGAR|nr:armadillo-type protein [Mycena metata]
MSRAKLQVALGIGSVLPAVIESLASLPFLPDQPHDELRILLGNVCSPLEENVMETIVPYLESHQISPLVKTVLLSTISQFQLTDEILAHTSFLSILLQLMESPDRVVLQSTCCTVCNIASYRSSPLAQSLLIKNHFIGVLVSVLRRPDASQNAVERAIEALAHLSSGSWGGTTTINIIEADAIPLLAELLRFHDPRILRTTCNILDYVASHQDTGPSLVCQISGTALVSVLGRSIYDETASAVLSVLSQIIQFDPQAVAVEAKDMILVLVRLLDTGNVRVFRWVSSALTLITRYHPLDPQLLRSDIGPAVILLTAFDVLLTASLFADISPAVIHTSKIRQNSWAKTEAGT